MKANKIIYIFDFKKFCYLFIILIIFLSCKNKDSFKTSEPVSPEPTRIILNKIAFVSNRDGNFEIYTMNIDGTELKRLTYNQSEDTFPSFSPDGSKIAFISARDGNYEIYTMNSDGSNQMRLTHNNVYDEFPSWSPDGSKIVFNSESDGEDDIYIMNSDGSNPINLTNNDTYIDSAPVFTPDGKKILFSSTRPWPYKICIMDVDGNNQKVLSPYGNDWFPCVSPDENFFIFETDYYPGIAKMKIDGSDMEKIVGVNYYNIRPYLAPDGKRIVYADDDGQGNIEIFIIDLNGNNKINITNNPAKDFFPCWR